MLYVICSAERLVSGSALASATFTFCGSIFTLVGIYYGGGWHIAAAVFFTTAAVFAFAGNKSFVERIAKNQIFLILINIVYYIISKLFSNEGFAIRIDDGSVVVYNPMHDIPPDDS